MITRILHRQRSCRVCGCVRFHPQTCVCLYVRVCVLSCLCMCVSVHQGSPGLGLHQCKQQIKTSFPILFHKERKGGFFLLLHEWKTRARPPPRVWLLCDVMLLPWLLCDYCPLTGGDCDLEFLQCVVSSQTNRHITVSHTHSDLKHAPRNSSSFGLVFRLISRCRCVCLC